MRVESARLCYTTRMKKIQHLMIGLALAVAAFGAGADDATPSVEVQGMKNPDMRSYRAVVAGLDAFEEHRALAPAAPELRFRLTARGGEDLPQGEPLYLRIVGNGDPIPLPVAPDGTFSVPRVQAAIDDEADLVLNRKKGVLQGRPEVRTPGLPANMRRLGDLRLECQVMLAIAKKELGLMLSLFINTVAMTTNWCDMNFSKQKVKFSFASLQALEGAELVEGDRRAALTVNDFSFQVPLGDSAWSNDARIELRYAPELTEEEKADPWRQTIFVVGTMSNWASRNAMRQVAHGVYAAELELGKGLHSMKFGTRGLKAISLGAPGANAQLAEGAATPLARPGRNLKLNVGAPGRYAITLDVREKDAPMVRVVRVEQPAPGADTPAPSPATATPATPAPALPPATAPGPAALPATSAATH